ncbi:carotenoid 1,2-hydratase [Pelomonas cellulosilytica]|uniref:Carotenoid 1,2-hydratase n=1 Tax=Pelomonas cellulosilytica TaxID=2906762 RepID=A0ABS8XUH9_9BURK|nr:carotenoid 1,2-hydratase [Pelomonas sp. P8]MCE4554383.1 carotenoid 1,2-hydratase [Pelomonas sp. P8]
MALPAGGYAWWYVDALSDAQADGSVHALTLIAFIGSVFSPYYAWARRRHGDDGAAAEAHCALNLSLYRRPPGTRQFSRLWAMTERGAGALQRGAAQLQLGPSRLAWQADGSLQVDVDEWTAPWPRRLQGRLRLHPGAMPGCDFALDAAGRHRWHPVSPAARIDVEFTQPALRWQGEAYLDANHGQRPLARDFRSWQWARSALPGSRSRVLYDVTTADGDERALALHIDADGRLTPLPPPPWQALRPTAWGVPRSSRGLQPPELLGTLESGPFYARSLLRDASDGTLAVHESLSLQRFQRPWVQALLPFRMPRRAGGSGGRG